MTGASIRAATTRAAILQHAARLFATKGFDGTSVQDIAESLGLTRPAVYHYFESKEDMLATLVVETSSLAAEKLAAIRRDEHLDSSAKLRAIAAAIARDRLESPEQFRMLERSEDSLPEPVGSQHRAARRAVLAEVTAVVHDGILNGEFRACDERLAALSVLGMCNWVAWWYHPESTDSPDAVVDALADNAVSMVARAPHRIPGSAGAHGAIAMLRDDLDYLDRLITGSAAQALPTSADAHRFDDADD